MDTFLIFLLSYGYNQLGQLDIAEERINEALALAENDNNLHIYNEFNTQSYNSILDMYKALQAIIHNGKSKT